MKGFHIIEKKSAIQMHINLYMFYTVSWWKKIKYMFMTIMPIIIQCHGLASYRCSNTSRAIDKMFSPVCVRYQPRAKLSWRRRIKNESLNYSLTRILIFWLFTLVDWLVLRLQLQVAFNNKSITSRCKCFVLSFVIPMMLNPEFLVIAFHKISGSHQTVEPECIPGFD